MACLKRHRTAGSLRERAFSFFGVGLAGRRGTSNLRKSCCLLIYGWLDFSLYRLHGTPE